MSVIIEGISVVVRVDTIKDRYPGGWDAFQSRCPNQTIRSDNELIAVGFMNPDDVDHFIGQLDSHGLVHLRDGMSQDFAVTNQVEGILHPCEWLEIGRVTISEDEEQTVLACRLVGTMTNFLATPIGWKFEGSLSNEYKVFDAGQISESMEFVRRKGNVDVYRDLQTGKESYIGRASGASPENTPGPRVRAVRLSEDRSAIKLEACRAYARMVNNKDFSCLEPWLHEDFSYSSQWVMEEMEGKNRFAEYIQAKLETWKKEPGFLRAQIAYTNQFGAGPCVVIEQDHEDNLIATLLITMKEDRIASMSMCGVPSPFECRRTGEFPS
jgi:hypothetical protein